MDSIRERFPLHAHAWNNDYEALDQLLTAKQGGSLEAVDPRGRTPLHLAVTLGHLESVRVLLRHGANADVENSNYWTAVQEAIATGDPELVQLCLQYREAGRNARRTAGVPDLLQRLTEAPDFYVEMKWEFASWVPLVSRMCPSDTYKVWKSGSNVRIDTTLVGFDNMKWQRGHRSFVFKGQGSVAVVMEVDHEGREVNVEHVRVLPPPGGEGSDPAALRPSQDAVAARLTAPIVSTYVDTEKIAFERSKSGMWGWRSDKIESVNNYSCKVFSASNVTVVTKTRTEHLTEADKRSVTQRSKHPLESLLGAVEDEQKQLGAAAVAGGDDPVDRDIVVLSRNPCCISAEEYFNPECSLGSRDIGRPIEQTTKTQRFKAQVWLCEDFPLSLAEQVVPIIDLMAASNAHFRKLKDFITLQLPSGFPVKIEIPLFHVLNARITFGNIFATASDVGGVVGRRDGEGRLTCTVDPTVFDAPPNYALLSPDMPHGRLRDEDDQLLQFAIQQSLLENGTEDEQVTLWEALNRSNSTNFAALSSDERLLQQVLVESIAGGGEGGTVPPSIAAVPPALRPPSYAAVEEEQLRLILEMSEREQQERERLRQEEEEELNRILALSLTDK